MSAWATSTSPPPCQPHLVLQGRPEPHRLPARHGSQGAREDPLLRRLDRHLGRPGGALARPAHARGRDAGRARPPGRGGEASASTSSRSRSRRASSTCRPAAQSGFGDEDHLWAESLDVNVKKLSDEEREKLVKDVQRSFNADIDDTEAYYEDARQRLKDVWKLFANKEEPAEDPPAEGEDWPLSAYTEKPIDKDEFRPKLIIPDETFFRELKHRFGSPFGFGEYFGGGMGAEHVRELLREKDGLGPRQGEARRRRRPRRGREPRPVGRAGHLPRPRARGPRGPGQERQGPEAGPRGQAPEGPLGLPALGQQARDDGPRGRAGHPAGAAPDGPARRRPLRDLRPQRPLPPRHQPQQPVEASARPRRAGDHRQQREAHAAGGRRRAVRQRPPRPARHGPGQPPAEVAERHAQGQAGALPPEPAGQARGLLGPLGHRGRPVAAPAPVRAAQAHGARAVQAVHHGPARRAQGGAEHQGGQEDGRLDDPAGVGRARAGHPRAPGAAQPRADAPPPGHPGLRAGAGRGQGDPGPPARLPRVQRRLRRRPDGGPPPAQRRGAGGGPHPDAVEQQHPVPRARGAAGDAVAGHGAGRLLPDLRPRGRRAGARSTRRPTRPRSTASARPRRPS